MSENLMNELLNPLRLRTSDMGIREHLEEFFSDKSRIIYSSSFRRLQQKAQVFSLEINSNVHSRLTHSLEVADVGRLLANKIARKLHHLKRISIENVIEIPAVVENACLMHDIGNLPFGHFGEAAVIKWARNNLSTLAESAGVNYKRLGILAKDFEEFDGNPQGIRIVTRLHCEKNKDGLNLTVPTLLCGVKYARAAGQPSNNLKYKKKAGYFQSEAAIIETASSGLGWNIECRYPLTYIMEAADDISYCLSDISDAMIKGIVSKELFLNEFRTLWKNAYGDEEIPVKTLSGEKETVNFGIDVCIDISHKAVDEAATIFVEHYDEFCKGTVGELITDATKMGKVLKIIKQFSRKYIYNSKEAESIELSGFAVISGLLNRYFGLLLKMPRDEFCRLTQGNRVSGCDYEERLLRRISERYIKSYNYQLTEWLGNSHAVKVYGEDTIEWWLRVHLILDQVSGMTDDFALAEYQMLEGISIGN